MKIYCVLHLELERERERDRGLENESARKIIISREIDTNRCYFACASRFKLWKNQFFGNNSMCDMKRAGMWMAARQWTYFRQWAWTWNTFRYNWRNSIWSSLTFCASEQAKRRMELNAKPMEFNIVPKCYKCGKHDGCRLCCRALLFNGTDKSFEMRWEKKLEREWQSKAFFCLFVGRIVAIAFTAEEENWKGDTGTIANGDE